MGFNMVYKKIVRLILNVMNVSMELQFHVLFDDMMYTVLSITATDLEVFI